MSCTYCGSERVVARGLCIGCYHRMRRRGTVARKNERNLHRRCSVVGCTEAAHAKGLCAKHYDRQQHPLKNTWKLIRSRYPSEVPKTWDAFAAFLKDVGERPGPHHQLRRADDALPYSAKNIRWIEPIPSRDSYTPEARRSYAREWALQRKYKITGETFRAMVIEQNGRCAICLDAKKLHVDHCHQVGTVRGLLCISCNRMLGYAKDNIETLRRAIAYLGRKRS